MNRAIYIFIASLLSALFFTSCIMMDAAAPPADGTPPLKRLPERIKRPNRTIPIFKPDKGKGEKPYPRPLAEQPQGIAVELAEERIVINFDNATEWVSATIENTASGDMWSAETENGAKSLELAFEPLSGTYTLLISTAEGDYYGYFELE